MDKAKKRNKIMIFFLISIMLISSIPIIKNNSVIAQQTTTGIGTLTVLPDTSRKLIRQYHNWSFDSLYTGIVDVGFAFDIAPSYRSIWYKDGANYVEQIVTNESYDLRTYYVFNNLPVTNGNEYRGYFEYDTPINTRGKWDMYIKKKGENWGSPSISLDPWWDSNWLYKKKITIDHNQVPGGLTNFPILINITDTDLKNNARTNGKDIAFADSTETIQFKHQIEEYTSGTGELICWVNVTSLSSTVDTVIYMYYGNPVCSAQWNVTGTWNSDYMAIYHMSNTTDSKWTWNLTSNGNPSIATGIVGDCYSFDGAGDYFSHATFLDSFPDEATYECFFLRDIDTDVRTHLITKTNIVSEDYMHLQVDDNKIFLNIEGLECGGNKRWTYIEPPLVTSTWYKGSATYNDYEVAYVWRNYTDQVNLGFIPTIQDGVATDFQIGAYNSGQEFTGDIDEVRISSVKRNDDWLITTWNTIMNSTDGEFITLFSQEDAPTLDIPENFTASTIDTDTIRLEWTVDAENANYTYIERNLVPSWIRNSGTLVYNDTGVQWDDSSSLSCGNIYYYRAWSFNESQHTFSYGSNLTNNITCPGNPTNAMANWNSTSEMFFTWTDNAYADTTALIRKSGDYPNSITDGTEIYNGSLGQYEETSFATTDYFALFSWNDTVNQSSTGLDVDWGVIRLRCYDENTSLDIPGWGIFISNQDGTQTYQNFSATNPCIISVGDLPYGDDTIFIFNATNNSSRVYIMDIAINNQYTLDAFLSDNDWTNLYYITVIDQYDQPINDATVTILKYINGSYENISILKTNGYGQVFSHLQVGFYKVKLEATGYITSYNNYQTDPDFYGLYYPTTFKMLATNETPTVYTFEDLISLTIEWQTNDTLGIIYVDNSESTLTLDIDIYETNGTTETLKNSYSYITNCNSKSIYTSGLNQSNTHIVKISNTHSLLGTVENYTILVFPIRNYTIDTTDLEQQLTDGFGDFDLGYVNTFIIWAPGIIILLGLAAINQPGFGIIGMGLWSAIASSKIETNLDENLFILFSLLVLLGIIALLLKKRGGGH